MSLLKRAQPEPVPALSGPYSGRLAFDGISGFHLAEDGSKVVTPDEGKSWHYAAENDPSHLERYQVKTVEVQQTANQFAELSVAQGHERARELVDRHHFEPQPEDPHFQGVLLVPDELAPEQTSHTKAYE